MSLLVRWKIVRCTGRDRKTGRPCKQVHLEVPIGTPKHLYHFQCRKCKSWNTVEV